MKKFGHWITNFFAITAAISVAGVQGAASEFANNTKETQCKRPKRVSHLDNCGWILESTKWILTKELWTSHKVDLEPQTKQERK